MNTRKIKTYLLRTLLPILPLFSLLLTLSVVNGVGVSVGLAAGEEAKKPETIKITDAEKVKLREYELAVTRAQLQMENAKASYLEAQTNQKIVTDAISNEIEGIKKKYKCPNCTLDARDLSLIPPAPTPPTSSTSTPPPSTPSPAAKAEEKKEGKK